MKDIKLDANCYAKRFTTVLTGLLMMMTAFAQNELKELNVGDQLPPIIISGLLGKEADSAQMEKLYRQGGLIINFWATWCAPCRKELPLLDSLVKETDNRLNVLSVTYEDEKKVNTFLDQLHSPLNNLTFVVGDTLLQKYFPNRVLPHNVWINRDGRVVNITGIDGVNRKNASDLVNNQLKELPIKTDAIGFDMRKPFHTMDSSYIYRSIFTGYAPGLPGGFTYKTDTHPTERQIKRLFGFNASREQMLWRAVGQMVLRRNWFDLMEIHTKDSTRFFWPNECPETFEKSKYKTKAEWAKENLYCYEIELPRAEVDTVFFKNVIQDLQRAMNISIRKEYKPILSTVIKMKYNNMISPTTVKDTSYITLTEGGLIAKNVEPLQLFNFLNEKVKANLNSVPLDAPYADETAIPYHIDVDLTFEGTIPNYDTMKTLLEVKYGFVFETKYRKREVTIIEDLAD
ncbi:TlpA family protein disulfide reductase [Olivibacter sp. SDN3]|uniref:TlpA family protein disulfide reductase n=1 Tax=Olivibacter sp. SDN3 TaxID=2764720 RepID=UPI0016516A91|nr:TlpA disulfide reductase family protein [Olivibacter sp. SDN3]QNL47901.1 TlpA family protein disulfide reductase [Olivibacter sp. SDN3]